MKKGLNIAAALLLAALATGCNDAEYGTLGIHAFINESTSSASTKVTIDPNNGAEAQLTVTLSQKAERNYEFRLVVDEEVMKTYNQQQASSYVALPAEVFEMPETVMVEAGSFSADPVTIHINPIPKELIGETYAIPLRLESVDGSVPTTSKTSTFVITTESITSSSLPMFTGGAGLSAEGFPVTLPEFTVECRFQVSNTSKRNRAVFTNGGSVLLRFEDPQNDDPSTGFKAHSLVQFQGEGWYLNPTASFTPNKWQHLALTYDGTKVTLYVNGAFAGSKEGTAAPDFKVAGWFGGGGDSGGHGIDDSWWSGCKILCSELRIWSVCRSAAQVQNNMTTTSAKSEGLVAYWRMNEGTGNTFEDCTGNGHTLKTEKTPVWVENILSTDTETEWPE